VLKTLIETLDGVDDAIKPFYTEADGKFILQIDGVDNHPDVANLKSAYERTKENLATAKADLTAANAGKVELPEGFTIEKWEKLKDGKPDEAALIKLRETLEGERDEWKGKFEAASATALRNATDRDLTDALNASGVTNPTFAKAARGMLADSVKIGDDGKPFVDTDMGPMPLSEHVKRWAASEGKDFVTPAAGGGGRGGDGKGASDSNPWKPETQNLTRQAAIMQSDPAEAQRLKASAGVN